MLIPSFSQTLFRAIYPINLCRNLVALQAIGPILLGMKKKPVHILQLGCSVREIVNMVTIAVVDAQSRGK